jgi:hypothetical protein
MTEGDIYETVETYCRQGKLACALGYLRAALQTLFQTAGRDSVEP